MLFLSNSYEEIRVIVVSKWIQEMISWMILSAPICNNKWSDSSYEPCYQLIDPIMILFVNIYAPVLI